MPRQNKLSKRLQQWAEYANTPGVNFSFSPERVGSLDIALREVEAKTGQSLPPLEAKAVLSLDPDDSANEAIVAAFAGFRLDHKNPWDWSVLVRIMSDILFGKRPVGRPPNPGTLQFRADFEKLKKDNPKKFVTDICKILTDPKRGRHAGKKATTLRRKLYADRRGANRPGDGK